MDTQLIKRTKIVLFFILTIALLGGVGYGRYRYWHEPAVEEKEDEVIENPDGSKTYYSRVGNYKITIPLGWVIIRDPLTSKGDIALRREGDTEINLNDLNIGVYLPTGKERRSFGEYIEGKRSYHRNIGKELIPQVPNIKFAGIPAYSYEYNSGSIAERKFVIIDFEHKNIWYEIFIPLQFKDDPEYWSILNTFEFLEE